MKNKKYKKILVCYGTRPEIIKLSPIINIFKKYKVNCKTVFTGQHTDLYNDVKMLIPKPDYHLSVMRQNQSLNNILVDEGYAVAYEGQSKDEIKEAHFFNREKLRGLLNE